MTKRLNTIEAQIEKLERKRKDLLQKEAAKERKRDTRRKILLGSLLLEMVAAEECNLSDDWLKERLDHFLKRKTDRQLFDLATPESTDSPSPNITESTERVLEAQE